VATTGWVFGTTATQVVNTNMAFTGGTGLANILDEDDDTISATTTSKNATGTVEVTNFGLQSLIPSGNTISQVNIRARAINTTGAMAQGFLARLGTTDGTEISALATVLTTTTQNAYARPGGGDWTRDDFAQATFKMRVRALQPNNTTSRTYQWAYVEVEVVHDVPAVAAVRTFVLFGPAMRRASWW
jgi:hypothetical protein